MSLPFSSTVSMCHVLSYEGVETEMTDTRTKSFFSCVCIVLLRRHGEEGRMEQEGKIK